MDRTRVLYLLSSRLGIVVIYLPILALLNMVKFLFPSLTFIRFVSTLNATFDLVVLFSIFFFLYEFFMMLRFPLNLPSSFFSALASFMISKFLFEVIFSLVGKGSHYSIFIGLIEPVFYSFMFITFLISGFVKMVIQQIGTKKKKA